MKTKFTASEWHYTQASENLLNLTRDEQVWYQLIVRYRL
jgi:hypothetical protein